MVHGRGSRFELTLVPSTRFWLRVQAQGHAPACVLVDARGGLVEGLEVSVVRGQRVRLDHAPEDLGRQVSIVTAAGGPIGTWSLGDRKITLTLAPGAYELWTGVAERVDERTPFVVTDEPVRLDVPPARK